MNLTALKQAEIFAFLAALFLVSMMFSERERLENPPIIVLSEENKEYRFSSGSSELSGVFEGALKSRIVPKLKQLSEKYKCDSIEIIGHTDSEPVKRVRSSMDNVSSEMARLTPGSNLDLGMMRALSILKVLKDAMDSKKLGQVKFLLPYSAGQFVSPDLNIIWGMSNNGDESRRRIEIRLTRSSMSDSNKILNI